MSLKNGIAELSPNQTAVDLFGHLKPGNKVAILTRFSAEQAAPYVEALEERGLKVRVISGQDGEQDFCFLMSATKEMIGIVYSTYLFWAGILSQTCKRVLAYSIDTTSRANTGRIVFMAYNWTHPDLKRKMEHKLIVPEIAVAR